MSRENVDFGRRFFDALDHRNEDTLMELVQPDVEFTSLIQEIEGRFRGYDGFRSYLRELFAAFPDWRVEVDQIRDIGDDAIVVRVHVTDWQALTVRDGKAAWWAFFRTEAEALKAVGPAE